MMLTLSPPNCVRLRSDSLFLIWPHPLRMGCKEYKSNININSDTENSVVATKTIRMKQGTAHGRSEGIRRIHNILNELHKALQFLLTLVEQSERYSSNALFSFYFYKCCMAIRSTAQAHAALYLQQQTIY